MLRPSRMQKLAIRVRVAIQMRHECRRGSAQSKSLSSLRAQNRASRLQQYLPVLNILGKTPATRGADLLKLLVVYSEHFCPAHRGTEPVSPRVAMRKAAAAQDHKEVLRLLGGATGHRGVAPAMPGMGHIAYESGLRSLFQSEAGRRLMRGDAEAGAPPPLHWWTVAESYTACLEQPSFRPSFSLFAQIGLTAAHHHDAQTVERLLAQSHRCSGNTKRHLPWLATALAAFAPMSSHSSLALDIWEQIRLFVGVNARLNSDHFSDAIKAYALAGRCKEILSACKPKSPEGGLMFLGLGQPAVLNNELYLVAVISCLQAGKSYEAQFLLHGITRSIQGKHGPVMRAFRAALETGVQFKPDTFRIVAASLPPDAKGSDVFAALAQSMPRCGVEPPTISSWWRTLVDATVAFDQPMAAVAAVEAMESRRTDGSFYNPKYALSESAPWWKRHQRALKDKQRQTKVNQFTSDRDHVYRCALKLCCLHGKFDAAASLWGRMRLHGLQPELAAHASFAKLCVRNGAPRLALEVFTEARETISSTPGLGADGHQGDRDTQQSSALSRPLVAQIAADPGASDTHMALQAYIAAMWGAAATGLPDVALSLLRELTAVAPEPGSKTPAKAGVDLTAFRSFATGKVKPFAPAAASSDGNSEASRAAAARIRARIRNRVQGAHALKRVEQAYRVALHGCEKAHRIPEARHVLGEGVRLGHVPAWWTPRLRIYDAAQALVRPLPEPTREGAATFDVSSDRGNFSWKQMRELFCLVPADAHILLANRSKADSAARHGDKAQPIIGVAEAEEDAGVETGADLSYHYQWLCVRHPATSAAKLRSGYAELCGHKRAAQGKGKRKGKRKGKGLEPALPLEVIFGYNQGKDIWAPPDHSQLSTAAEEGDMLLDTVWLAPALIRKLVSKHENALQPMPANDMWQPLPKV